MNLGGTVRLNAKGWALIAFVAVVLLIVHLNSGGGKRQVAIEVSGSRLLGVAVRAAVAGGVAVERSHSTGVRSKGKTREGADELLTDADRASHCRMVDVVRRAIPALPAIVSEESVVECPPHDKSGEQQVPQDIIERLRDVADESYRVEDVVVWIDPLDATQEFTEGLEQYVTTMVCVAIKGQPVIGVVHKPFQHETTWAWVSKASSIDQNRQQPDDSKRATNVIVSRSHSGKVETFVKNVIGKDTKITLAGGAGYKVLEVINGNADVYMHTTLIKKWDICAGNALINAAGGRMTTLHNETIDYSKGDPFNRNGLLVALNNHNVYIEKSLQANLLS